MEILDTTQACFVVDDDLFDFTLEGGEGEEEVVDPTIFKGAASASSSSLDSSNLAAAAASFGRGNLARSFPEFVEEELEWLSNKDAFPAVETCFGILSDNPELVSNHQSPVSVLENSTVSSNSNNNNNNNSSSSVASCCNSLKVPTNHPVRARTKRSRRRRDSVQHSLWLSQVNRHVFKKSRRDIPFSLPPAPVTASSGGAGDGTGRRCSHCHTDKTPQWRAGPTGPKTLCNACGVRYKSGRLLPEYRPANSPTFSSVLHSNSHRKVVEMRKQKQVGPGEGISCGYSLG